MRLADLLDDRAALGGAPAAGLSISGLSADSREIAPGFLFAALEGTKTDGRCFLAEAVARGATAVLVPPGTELPAEASRVCVLIDGNPRRRFALLAAAFHKPQPERTAAVTGTNGKSTVGAFTRQIWAALGVDAVSVGTLGIESAGGRRKTALTTPDSVSLHRALASAALAGARRAVVEASSHGLAQHRLDGVTLAAAAFTNLSRDHLDYHGSLAAYRAAKLRLFEELLPAGATAVLNRNSPEFEDLARRCRARGCPVLDYGRAAAAFRLVDSRPDADGQVVDLIEFGRRSRLRLGFPGGFQAANALCAAALVAAVGDDRRGAVEALESLRAPAGRLQCVARSAAGAPIYVDFAHTPDALSHVLRALRAHTRSRLWVVFGCGGDRDPGKRSPMGEAAARLADRVIVTDDNPRGEDPRAIRATILSACGGALEIADRRAAIRTAIDALADGDVLVIAGKGHETGQIVGGAVRPFDDASEARAAARAAGGVPE